MATITFDTFAYANKLKAAGVPDKQAEAQAKAQKDLFSEVLDTTIATKGDINRLEANIRELELHLTIKLGAIVAAGIALVAALVKLL